MIHHIHHDILTSGEKVIMHGCNAQGVMRSGIAKAIREKYPLAYETYAKYYKSQGNYLALGMVMPVPQPDGVTIINAITQKFYGRDPNTRYVSYDAIETAILCCNRLGYERIAIPKIGAGLGNGNWKVIETIFSEIAKFDTFVYSV